MWTALKGLNTLVEAVVGRKHSDGLVQLDAALKKHRADFINLLKNPVSH